MSAHMEYTGSNLVEETLKLYVLKHCFNGTRQYLADYDWLVIMHC